MNFRDYRSRKTIRAAEITEEKMSLIPADSEPESMKLAEFSCGDYAQIVEGVLYGRKKADFELDYAPIRQPRQPNGQKKQRKPRQSAVEAARARAIDVDA